MSKFSDEDDARTIRAWQEWLGGDQVADLEAAIVAFLAAQRKAREEQYQR